MSRIYVRKMNSWSRKKILCDFILIIICINKINEVSFFFLSSAEWILQAVVWINECPQITICKSSDSRVNMKMCLMKTAS